MDTSIEKGAHLSMALVVTATAEQREAIAKSIVPKLKGDDLVASSC